MKSWFSRSKNNEDSNKNTHKVAELFDKYIGVQQELERAQAKIAKLEETITKTTSISKQHTKLVAETIEQLRTKLTKKENAIIDADRELKTLKEENKKLKSGFENAKIKLQENINTLKNKQQATLQEQKARLGQANTALQEKNKEIAALNERIKNFQAQSDNENKEEEKENIENDDISLEAMSGLVDALGSFVSQNPEQNEELQQKIKGLENKFQYAKNNNKKLKFSSIIGDLNYIIEAAQKINIPAQNALNIEKDNKEAINLLVEKHAGDLSDQDKGIFRRLYLDKVLKIGLNIWGTARLYIASISALELAHASLQEGEIHTKWAMLAASFITSMLAVDALAQLVKKIYTWQKGENIIADTKDLSNFVGDKDANEGQIIITVNKLQEKANWISKAVNITAILSSVVAPIVIASNYLTQDLENCNQTTVNNIATNPNKTTLVTITAALFGAVALMKVIAKLTKKTKRHKVTKKKTFQEQVKKFNGNRYKSTK